MLCFCLVTAMASFGRRKGADQRPCAIAAAAMLVLTAAARGRWRLYEERRTLAMSLARLVIFFGTCSTAFLYLPLVAHAWGAAFLQSRAGRSSGAAHAAAVAFASGRASSSSSQGGSVGSGDGVGGGVIDGVIGGGGGGGASAFSPDSRPFSSFGAGVPGYWLAAASNSTPWERHWLAFFTRTPRVHALLLPSLLVAPPRAHALVSLLCALGALAVLGSTVAGREAYFGRERHVEVARFMSSLARWVVRLPASSAAATLAGVSRPLRQPREISEDRATGAVMITLQLCLGLVLPTHVMFAWQAQARRAFRDSEVARRKREEEGRGGGAGGGGGEEEEEVEKVGGAAKRRRGSGLSTTRPRPSSSSAAASASAALLQRSARVDSVLLALGMQLSAVVCFWVVLEELDALAGERKLWFSLP